MVRTMDDAAIRKKLQALDFESLTPVWVLIGELSRSHANPKAPQN